MWQYRAFVLAGYTVAFLPKRFGYMLSRVLADALYLFFPRVRTGIAINQRHVLGPKAMDSVIRNTVRGVLRNTVYNYFDLIKLPRAKRLSLERSIKVNGWEHVETALAKGKGVVFVTAHLGSFDTAAQIFALKSLRTTVLVEPIKPAKLLSHIIWLRQSHGVTFLPSQPGALNELFKCLRRGEIVLFASDRDIDNNGLQTDFFGKETTLPTIAVRIAMKTGAALIPIFSRRKANGKIEINLEPSIETDDSGNGASLADKVKEVARVMERYIGENPEQWVVLNPVWPAQTVAKN
jgi:lauroyl/myristoyl acyltransferase